MNKNTIKGLQQREVELAARLTYEKKKIVSAREIDSFLPANFKYRKQLVYGLKQKGVLTAIKRGIYLFTSLDSIASGSRINEFLIPAVYFPKGNYYIGYSTMFNYYGLTDQLFQVVYVLNATLCREKLICGVTYKFVKTSKERLYGCDRIVVENTEVMVSSKERTLVDLIYFNKPVGGLTPAAAILKEIVRRKACDLNKLVKYAARFPNVSTRKRIGFLLDGLGVSKLILSPLAKSVEKSAISSWGASRKGPINKTWRIIYRDTPK